MDGNDLAAAFIHDLTWDALPPEVQRRARICLLDDLGSVLSGTLTRISRIAAGYAQNRFPGNEASIVLHGARVSVPGAAFANATSGNALDIDDDLRYTKGHPGVQVFSAALAVGEKVNASGRDLLEALVVGYETASLAGHCWHDDHAIYQACGSWGSVATAAVSARLMGLTTEQTKHALGIADYHAPNAPMMRDIDNPSMSKHAIGWGTMNGVMSAELADRGYTGVPAIFGHEKYRRWVEDLGRVYVMADGVGGKRWCSCAWGHPSMVAAWNVVSENVVQLSAIDRIEVHTFGDACRLVQDVPRSTEEAQFSVKWPLAALLIDGEVGPDQILEHRFSDPEVLALFHRIEMIEDPDLERFYQTNKAYDNGVDDYLKARVIVHLTDGRVFDSGVTARGAFYWDEETMEAKFRSFAGHVLDAERIDRLGEMIWQFEQIDAVRSLIDNIG